MNLGKLDRRLLLQAPAEVAQDEYGALAPAGWVDVATVWARVKFPQGVEAYQADQLTATQPVVLELRHRPDVLPTWRGLLEGKIYGFTAVADIGRRVGLSINGLYRGVAPESADSAEADGLLDGVLDMLLVG